MRVFVTGATGYVGAAVVRELLGAGHDVVGLARSDAAAASLVAAGVSIHRGDLDDLGSLRRGVATADGVIHAARTNLPETGGVAAAMLADRSAIEAIGETLAGSGKPFVVTSSLGLLKPAQPGGFIMEDSAYDRTSFATPRIAAEEAALAPAAHGVRVSTVRLGVVHGTGDTHSYVQTLINVARSKGVSAYPGDGTNRWPAVHLLDAAHLFRLALENAPAGARLHGVGDEDVPLRAIAAIIGQRLRLPTTSLAADQVPNHFGWFAPMVSLDLPASSARTQQQLGWQPVQPGLIRDLEAGPYFHEEDTPVAAR
jgi:nucleoside-diphosphate-sugar epimerase